MADRFLIDHITYHTLNNRHWGLIAVESLCENIVRIVRYRWKQRNAVILHRCKVGHQRICRWCVFTYSQLFTYVFTERRGRRPHTESRPAKTNPTCSRVLIETL